MPGVLRVPPPSSNLPRSFPSSCPLTTHCESRSSVGSQVEPPLDGRDRLLSNIRRTRPARIDTPSRIFLPDERIKDRINLVEKMSQVRGQQLLLTAGALIGILGSSQGCGSRKDPRTKEA